MAFYNLKEAAASVPVCTVPARMPGSGISLNETTDHIDGILKKDKISDPVIAAIAI